MVSLVSRIVVFGTVKGPGRYGNLVRMGRRDRVRMGIGWIKIHSIGQA